MKTNGHAEMQIAAGNLQALRNTLSKLKADERDFGLLLLIADMYDEIYQGKDRYMTLGATRNKSAFSAAIKGLMVPDPLYGIDLADIQGQALELL